MNRPTAIIAEDEENLRTSLITMLEKLWPELHICGEAENGSEAIDLIEQEDPDIVFLDIKMPEISGIQVAQKISRKQKIVFVTAYDQYAVQAFEREAIDYILKPITEERLAKTIGRLKNWSTPPDGEPLLSDNISRLIKILDKQAPADKLRVVKVKTRTGIQFIPVSHIYFFKAEHKYTTVQTTKSEFIIKTPIKELESRLDADRFWKVHRSAIVNIDKIYKIQRSATNRMVITFANTDKSVTVSKAYEHLFKHM